MKQVEYKLKDEFIPLAALLKVCDVVSSGGEVGILLADDRILYNGEVEFRKRKKCYSGDEIIIDNNFKIMVK